MEEKYSKELRTYNEEFMVVHESIIEIIKEQPLKEIRIGFSYHYCKLNCKGIKIFWRYNKKRMNNPKLVFKTKDFEIEAEQGSWEEVIVKTKGIEIETRGANIYFIFQKSIGNIFKNKLRTKGGLKYEI